MSKEHNDECECCECHGHEWVIESAQPVGDENACVMVCLYCDATANPEDMDDYATHHGL